MSILGRELSGFRSEFSFGNKLARAGWGIVWILLFRPSPRVLHGWRRILLRFFGADVAKRVRVYGSARIWAPWNLSVGQHSVIGEYVDCYSVARISIGKDVVVSQYAHLCAATHDYRQPSFPLLASPIVIEDGAWVAAGAFIGPGVTIGQGAVVAARACVVRDVPAGAIVIGNPARLVHS